jgi:predicted DNA-binding transcriptional regulator
MRKGVVTLMFEKGSKWVGVIYPCFDRESEQKLFEKKRERINKLLKKIENVLND